MNSSSKLSARHVSRRSRAFVVLHLTALLVCTSGRPVTAQSRASLLTTREELTAEVQKAERREPGSVNASTAAAIRVRLADGDFEPGDRIILRTYTDAVHTDTLVVRAGRTVDIPGAATMSLAGVLRSEAKARISAEALKYVKADQIDVIPLTRVAVLGEVARPGYFALPSDVPLTEAIMAAGGPTANADVERSLVRSGDGKVRSSSDTKRALAQGLTLDQFGLSAGDEIVIGRRRDSLTRAFFPIVGALGSLTVIWVTLHRH
jgi:protein involved in polysaccharide export with SLBB domain